MPEIRNIGLQQRAVGPIDYAQARPDTAFAQAGKEAERASATLNQIADQDAAVAGLKALSDFDAKSTARMQELQQNAQSPDGFGETWANDWDARANELISNTADDRVARFLGERLAVGRERAVVQGMAWEATQKEALQATQFDQSLGQIASGVTSDPTRFPEALANIDATLKAGRFDPAKREALWTSATHQLARSYVSGLPPDEALRQLQSGSLDKYIDPDNKIALINHLDAQLRMRDASSNQDALDLAQSNIKSITETGQHLPPAQEAQIASGLSERQRARYLSQVQKAEAVYRATGDMGTVPFGEMVARVEKLKPTPGSADYSDQQAAYDAALQRMHQVMNARRADPGLAVRQAFPDVAGAWQAYEAKNDPASLQGALKASQTAQTMLGIPIVQQRLMPDELARSLAGQIKGAPPEKAAETLNAVAQQFGPYWPKAFRQMSQMLDPASKVAATIDDSATAALLIETSRQKFDELLRTTGVKRSDILQQILGDQRWLDFTSIAKREGGSQTANDVFQAVQTLALGRMRAFQEDQTTATDKAIGSIIGNKYDFAYSANGQAFRVPKGRDFARIQGAARDALDALTGDGIDVPGLLPGQTRADGIDRYMSAVHRNGYWVTNDDESGVVLYNERGVPVTAHGKPVEFKFDRLEAAPPGEPLFPLGAGGGAGGPDSLGPQDPTDFGDAGDGGAAQNDMPTIPFDEARARQIQQAKARGDGVPAEGESFIPGISTPVSQLRNGGMVEGRYASGAQQRQALRDNATSAPYMMSEQDFANIPPGTSRDGKGPTKEDAVATAYRGIKYQQGLKAEEARDAQVRQQLESMSRSFGEMNSALADWRNAQRTGTDKIARENNLSEAQLSRRLTAATTRDEKFRLIQGLTEIGLKAEPAKRREILKQLDKHFADATWIQKALIMELHIADARDRGLDSVFGEDVRRGADSVLPRTP